MHPIPRGSHRDASHGLELPSLCWHGTVALQAPARGRWHSCGAGWGLPLAHGSTQARGRVAAAAELGFAPSFPCPRANLTQCAPGLTGCLRWQPLQAEPPGLSSQRKVPPPHGKGGSGEPRAEAKTSSPPGQHCRIKFLQHFAGGRNTPARH